MDPTDIHELKIMVERVVRPVRAELSRKMTMRQELLYSLISAYEVQIAQGAESKRALEYCTGVLGDPREATARLKQSVTWLEWATYGLDRYLLDLAVGRCCTSRASLRGIVLFGLMVWMSAFILIVLVNALFWLDDLRRFSEGLGICSVVMAGAVLYFIFYFSLLKLMANSFWDAFCRLPIPDWPRVILVAVVAIFFLPSFYFGYRLLITNGNLPTTLHDTLRWFPAYALAIPYSLLLFVKVGKRLVNGPADEEWRKRLRDFAWAVPLSLIVFVAASIISHNFVVGVENAVFILLLTVFWLAPFGLVLTHPRFITVFRICLEWEKLPIEQHMLC